MRYLPRTGEPVTSVLTGVQGSGDVGGRLGGGEGDWT